MHNYNFTPELHDLQFYRDSTSSKSQIIYCFRSEQSMEHFQKHEGRDIRMNPDGLFDGLPLFLCKLEGGSKKLASRSCTNYTIYKYVIIPSDSTHPDKKLLEKKYLHSSKEHTFLGFNAEYHANIYRYMYCEFTNNFSYSSSNTVKNSVIRFKKTLLHMTFNTFNDFITISENQYFDEKFKGNLFIDGFYMKNEYSFKSIDGDVTAEVDYTNRPKKWLKNASEERICNLRFPVERNPPEYSTNEKIQNYMNDYLIKFHEEIVCMVFVIINFNTAEEKRIISWRY